MISKYHLWNHVYQINTKFQEYWECKHCGHRIDIETPCSFRRGNTIWERIPDNILDKITQANELGCPFFLVQRIMESWVDGYMSVLIIPILLACQISLASILQQLQSRIVGSAPNAEQSEIHTGESSVAARSRENSARYVLLWNLSGAA